MEGLGKGVGRRRLQRMEGEGWRGWKKKVGEDGRRMLERMEEESWRGGKDKVRGNGRRRLKGLVCKGVYIGGKGGSAPFTCKGP